MHIPTTTDFLMHIQAHACTQHNMLHTASGHALQAKLGEAARAHVELVGQRDSLQAAKDSLEDKWVLTGSRPFLLMFP